ncbi:MAG: mechanosensitive ion channel family protein [Myxococcales bacterium]
MPEDWTAANTLSLPEKLFAKLQGWLEDFVVMLPNLLLAALVLTLGALLGRWVERGLQKLLRRITGNDALSRLSGSVARLATITLSGLWALALLHLDKTVTSVLAGVGVVGLALGFAFQDIVANFTCGVIMALYRPFDAGDLVEIAGRQCKVGRILLRCTEVETLDGLTIIIPNKDVLQNPIISYTHTNRRRMDLTVCMTYSDDMEKVRKAVLAAVADCPGRDPSKEVELFFSSFADSWIDYEVRIWLLDASQVSYLRARSEAMIAIKKAYDREGFRLPFPVRTLDFDADGVGGKAIDRYQLRASVTQ